MPSQRMLSGSSSGRTARTDPSVAPRRDVDSASSFQQRGEEEAALCDKRKFGS
jgi:hypothetical protein